MSEAPKPSRSNRRLGTKMFLLGEIERARDDQKGAREAATGRGLQVTQHGRRLIGQALMPVPHAPQATWRHFGRFGDIVALVEAAEAKSAKRGPR